MSTQWLGGAGWGNSPPGLLWFCGRGSGLSGAQRAQLCGTALPVILDFAALHVSLHVAERGLRRGLSEILWQPQNSVCVAAYDRVLSAAYSKSSRCLGCASRRSRPGTAPDTIRPDAGRE